MANQMFRASDDGTAGLTAQANGQFNHGAADELGRLWVRVFGAATFTGEVEGFTPHGDPDPGDENPVYIGGFASANPRAAVNEGDRAGASTDLESRQRVRVSGIDPSNTAGDVPLDPALALAVGGAVAHDAAYTQYPVPIGGYADDEAPAAVGAVARAVRAWLDRVGRQHVYHDLAFAGENQVHDFVAMARKILAVEQNTCLVSYEPGVLTTETAKGAAGRLYAAYISNESGGPLFFQIHNTTGAPGAVAPFMTPWRVPDQGALFLDFSNHEGLYLDTGITGASSSTFATFTGSAGLHMTLFAF